MVLEEIETTRPRVWLGGSILEFTLLHHWLEVQDQATVYFLSVETVTHLRDDTEPSSDELHQCRRRMHLPDDAQLRMMPVILILLHANHCFVVVFDYMSNRVHVLGRSIHRAGPTMNVQWEEWKGPVIWAQVANMFGWATSSGQQIYKLGQDWHQVSHSVLSGCPCSHMM
jgi:hypothetical protein